MILAQCGHGWSMQKSEGRWSRFGDFFRRFFGLGRFGRLGVLGVLGVPAADGGPNRSSGPRFDGEVAKLGEERVGVLRG